MPGEDLISPFSPGYASAFILCPLEVLSPSPFIWNKSLLLYFLFSSRCSCLELKMKSICILLVVCLSLVYLLGTSVETATSRQLTFSPISANATPGNQDVKATTSVPLSSGAYVPTESSVLISAFFFVIMKAIGQQ